MRIAVDEALAGTRLDKLVAERGLGRARARKLFAAGKVRVCTPDGRRRRADKGERSVAGAVIEVDVADDELREAAEPDDALPLAVLLENDDLVIVDKPAGVPSAPLAPGERGTIANALVARYPEMAEVGFSPREPGLCHRLDVDTSGLLLAARHRRAFEALTTALKSGLFDKRYLLVCRERALPPGGVIDLPLAPDPKNRRRVRACRTPAEAARHKAKPARTRYRVLERREGRALVEARAPRAYRHQIRAHFAALRHPLVGDALYGGELVAGLGRHALHASHLGYKGDRQVAPFSVDSPLPPDLRGLLPPLSRRGTPAAP